MTHDRASTQLPPEPRIRVRGRDWGRLLARVLCVILALIGLLPMGIVLVLRSHFVRNWAVHEVEGLLRGQGIVATYKLSPNFWPLGLELRDLRVESTDGGSPVLSAARATVRPKFFGLLSGKLAIEQIDVEAPKARVVMRDGKLMNLAIELPKSSGESKGPFHAPFGVFAITDGEADVEIDGIRAVVHGLDLDVVTDDDPDEGSSFEIAVRVGDSVVNRRRTDPSGTVRYDEDSLCLLDGRVRIEPHSITVHRFRASASADLDPKEGTLPPCNLPDTDVRKVEVELAHTHVRLPEKSGDLPRGDGRVKLRAPLALGGRAGPFPDSDGWVSVDADIRFVEGMNLPDVSGRLEAHDLRIDHYRFSREIISDLVTKQNVITSPRTTVAIADGMAVLSDVRVEPLAKGIPLSAKVEVHNAGFSALMRDLGVSQHPHVTWDLKEVKVEKFAGTLDPLKLDGELYAHTPNFAVFDLAVDDPAKARIIGVKEAELQTHVSVRPEALQFKAVHVQTSQSTVDNGYVSIGFHEDLRVEIPSAVIELAEIGPLGTIPIAGRAQAKVLVSGKFTDPKLEGDAAIENFVMADIPFGNVTQGQVTLDGLVVGLKSVKANKGKSTYEMPSGKLDFGGKANMAMDAVVTSPGFNLRDFFALFKMEEDPRFLEMDATFTTNAHLRVALGGPQDRCKGGFIDVDAHAHLRDVKMFGEVFEDGDLDLDYEWEDRLAGLNGARIEVKSATLRKVRPNPAGMSVGTVLGSANIEHGALNGNVVLQGIPLSRIQSLGAFAPQVDGSVSGFAQVSGTLDAYNIEGNVDVTPLLVRGTRMGGSHAHLLMTQNAPPKVASIGKTACGAPIAPPFDKNDYKPDSLQGEFRVTGDFFDGQVKVDDLSMTREKDMLVAGKVALKKLDLGAVFRIAQPPNHEALEEAAPSTPMEGEISGELTIDRLRRSDVGHAEVHFVPGSLFVERGGQKLTMRSTSSVLFVKDDTLAVPPITFDLQAGRGLKGTVTVRGAAHKLTQTPELAFNAELVPIDLGVLVGIVPKVDRAQGTLGGSLYVTGKATSPEVNGHLQVRGGEFAINGMPSPISAVELDVEANSSEIRIARGTGRFAGGTLAVSGQVPLRGFSLGAGEVLLRGRNIRLAPVEGVTTTLDADITAHVSPPSEGTAKTPLPHLTGDVLVTSFEYTRPIALTTDLSALGVRAKRTVVESYDPSQDALTLDINVRNRGPLRIRNNLVEVQLGIDPNGLHVTGTNQRVGLRGELRAQQGGRFHLRSTDFDVRQAIIRFEDPTRIDPNVDVVAVTEYRRYGVSATASGAAGGRSSGLWRITLHAYGDTDNLHLDMTSDPPLSQEDIVLLLTVGMTRAEVDQLQSGALGAGVALEALSTASGADRAVKEAIPVIDDFRFGSGYSARSGRTEPQVTVGKRLTEDVRASVTTGLSEDRELRSNIEWRLGQKIAVQGSYDNVNDVSSSAVGNVGIDFRWRLEFK
jgi:translocation and assembly module TamB